MFFPFLLYSAFRCASFPFFGSLVSEGEELKEKGEVKAPFSGVIFTRHGHSNPQTYAGCENKAGKVVELWARRKNAEHPVFDRQTGRRLQPLDFCALAFERHGFMAKETKSFIQKLARIKAAHYELDPSEEIRKWCTVISGCVQRANARILSGCPRPGRRNPPPRSLLAGVRDLVPCGTW